MSKGKQPRPPAKVPKSCSVGKDVILLRQPGCWLRSSHPFKECVIAHWSSGAAPKIHGAKHDTEAVGSFGQKEAFEKKYRAKTQIKSKV